MELQAISNGRPIKFTPERIEQIRNLVERGKTREEIAEIIGTTVGSLQVTCSRHGISLRPPKSMRPARPMTEARMGSGNGGFVLTLAHPKPLPEMATISLVLTRNGRSRETPLSIDQDAFVRLILEAQIRGMSLPELVAELIRKVMDDRALLDKVAPLAR